MKKVFYIFFVIILICSASFNLKVVKSVFASPENTLQNSLFAEKLLIKLQNTNFIEENQELEYLYKYLEVLYSDNSQFFSYKIEALENLMNCYREYIVKNARELASNTEYKKAVEYLESKSELFKDKTTINSLINHYSKFFIKDGLFYCETAPKILSINKLISYPNLAFADNNLSQNYDKLYLTNREFYNLLTELYLNDYVLINLTDYLDLESEIVAKKDIYLPQNKKPLILIFNDINYCENDAPFIEKYIIDSKNEVACFNSKQTEKNQISATGDFIPILENFISLNKDFSLNNAKSVITFNSSGAILGYNICKTNPNVNQDTLSLKKLATFLKEKGYNFGYSVANSEFSKENDTTFLEAEIFNIFGNLKVCFTGKNENKIEQYYYDLNNIGFKVFISLGENNCLIKNNLALISSIKIDGDFLRTPNPTLKLNYDNIYDHSNRTTIFKFD